MSNRLRFLPHCWPFPPLLGTIPLCHPKIIPIHRDISIWISFCLLLHFKSHKAHIVGIHLWTIWMISIQVLCHVVDLKHSFVTSWENVLFTLENIGRCVKMTWNYFQGGRNLNLSKWTCPCLREASCSTTEKIAVLVLRTNTAIFSVALQLRRGIS